MNKLFSLLLLFIVISPGAYAKDRAYWWVCAADDDTRSLFVNYPLRGAAKVQLAGTSYISTVDTEEKNEDKKAVRFDFDNNKQSVIITLEREKKAQNLYRAGLYNFQEVEQGETAFPIQFVCLSLEK